ncbi:Cytochrome P450 [Penicillium cf. griseofulvum]|nr:Cytochrome P450 [Penicillium cf. griseofulvum]
MLSEIGSHFQSTSIFVSLSIGALITLIYRHWFHPLSQFPGPPLAGVSGLWQVWQDMICSNFPRSVTELHRKYSRILKVNSDYLKDPTFYEQMGIPDALGTICDPLKHRILRRRQAVNQMAGVIQTTIKNACDLITENFDAQSFFRAIAGDIVSTHYFGENMNLIDRPEYAHKLWGGIDTIVGQMWYSMFPAHPKDKTHTESPRVIHIPYLASILAKLPSTVLKISLPGLAGLIEVCMRQSEKAFERNKIRSTSFETDNATFFDLLTTPSLGQQPVHLSQNDLVNHGLNLVGAGVDTVSLTMTVALYHILSSPEIKRQVYSETREATPFIRDKLDSQRVRTLPYLGAVIKETLRMYPPVPGRMPRVVPPQGESYNGNFIPGGTIVSVSPYTIHRDPKLFSEPNVFKPERWLGDNTLELERALIPFSTGSRMCPGIQ